jgi:hypothetical protein
VNFVPFFQDISVDTSGTPRKSHTTAQTDAEEIEEG